MMLAAGRRAGRGHRDGVDRRRDAGRKDRARAGVRRDPQIAGAPVRRGPRTACTRPMSGETGLDQVLEAFDARAHRPQDARRLSGVRNAAADDRLHRRCGCWRTCPKAIASRRWCTATSGTAISSSSRSKGVVAVLDWELAHIGDPMRDLGWLVHALLALRRARTSRWAALAKYDDLFAGYESVSGRKVDRAAVQVLGSVRIVLVVGRHASSMAQSFRDGSEPSVERPGIGRRSSECQIDCVNLAHPGLGAQAAGRRCRPCRPPNCRAPTSFCAACATSCATKRRQDARGPQPVPCARRGKLASTSRCANLNYRRRCGGLGGAGALGAARRATATSPNCATSLQGDPRWRDRTRAMQACTPICVTACWRRC